VRERLLHALDLGMLGDWEAAKRSLENLDDPMVPRLISLMTQQQRYERDRSEAQALARHELGNALSIAQANIEAMIDGVLEPSVERLYGIRSALQTCGALLDDLKKNYPSHREPEERVDTFNICDLIAAQIRLVSTIAETKNVRVSYRQHAHDRDCAEYHGDPDRIAHIVRNMLLSAVRYTPPGGTIEIEYGATGGELELSVRHSHNGQGDGLGFPLASKLLEALGTTAHLRSESPTSNTFVLKLPTCENTTPRSSSISTAR
jgi:signal transduction histidine kinase